MSKCFKVREENDVYIIRINGNDVCWFMHKRDLNKKIENLLERDYYEL